jgi:hypothetical protein
VEWPAMKAGDHGPRSAGDGLGKVLTALLADDHAGGNRRAAEEHTVRALERALDAQRQRLFISQTSVSGIKWFVFMVLAGLIELTIAMRPVASPGRLDFSGGRVGIFATTEAPMKPNGLVLAGLIVTLVGLFIVIRHSLAIPSYWTPLLVGIGLLVAGVIWSAWQRKSKAS